MLKIPYMAQKCPKSIVVILRRSENSDDEKINEIILITISANKQGNRQYPITHRV